MFAFLLVLSACPDRFADPEREFGSPVTAEGTYADEVHTPEPGGVWHSPLKDDPKFPQAATCDTCHGPNPKNFATAKPGEAFHTTIEITHGNLTCAQCHDADKTKLHLADGTQFDFSEVVRLCGQCHGPQAKDYLHGAHGGKNGYWDKRQGAAIRNNCTDCHTPHAPAFPTVQPVFPPRDRYFGEH